ncbi:MAG: hypothetical protein JST16_11850 [Bdellovibrionales bacterium]|nr:hypothetical protein [Bdellovibrionales bacterium]
MSKKTLALKPKTAICKEPNCFDAVQVKGYCRLHFLKVLAGKSEGDAQPRGELKVARERRSSNRLQGLDTPQVDDAELSQTASSAGELDGDVDVVDLDSLLKKTA